MNPIYMLGQLDNPIEAEPVTQGNLPKSPDGSEERNKVVKNGETQSSETRLQLNTSTQINNEEHQGPYDAEDEHKEEGENSNVGEIQVGEEQEADDDDDPYDDEDDSVEEVSKDSNDEDNSVEESSKDSDSDSDDCDEDEDPSNSLDAHLRVRYRVLSGYRLYCKHLDHCAPKDRCTYQELVEPSRYTRFMGYKLRRDGEAGGEEEKDEGNDEEDEGDENEYDSDKEGE